MAVGSLSRPDGDLRHGEAAHGLERKGDAHLGRQRGMADGEQQRQLVVVQLAIEAALAFAGRGCERNEFLGEREAARLVAQQVERTVAGDDRQPCLGPAPARP